MENDLVELTHLSDGFYQQLVQTMHICSAGPIKYHPQYFGEIMQQPP
jgi:hypothetical protein